MHLKKNHQQAWKGEKSDLFHAIKVQTFFNSGGLQKYFLIDLGVGVNSENREKLHQKQVVAEQLNKWKKVREQLVKDGEIMAPTAKIDKTGWFKIATKHGCSRLQS